MTAKSNNVRGKAIINRSSETADNEMRYSTRPTEEEIRLRAYQIYIDRGKMDGHHLADWLQAENELATLQDEDAGNLPTAAAKCDVDSTRNLN